MAHLRGKTKYLALLALIGLNTFWSYSFYGWLAVAATTISWAFALLVTIGPLNKAFEQNVVNKLCGRTCKAKK
jgi:heme exporter protein D